MTVILTRPRRRPAWEEELRRLDGIWRERRFRDEQRILAVIAGIERRLGDLQQRLTDFERRTGVADLGRPPRGRAP